MENPKLVNPHLEGDAFFWKAGLTGILLSHGYTATSAEIRYLAKAFHKKGYTVAGPLLPGHGTQPGDLNRVRWQDWVQAGEELLTKLLESCDRVFVGGESMGGLLALYLASQEPRIAGVLLYAPAISITMSARERLKLYAAAPFITQMERESLDCATEWQGYPGLPLKGTIQLLRFQEATRKRLSQIYQPVLIFQGQHDATVAPEAGEIILNGIMSSVKEHYWMKNSSHTIALDIERDRVAEMSIQFMGKCEATG